MRKSARSARPLKRRTTLTLPVDALERAERLAIATGVNLSSAVAQALEEGLRSHSAVERSEQVLRNYRKAFLGFTEDELLILDGVAPESKPDRRA
ncbi:MAG: hypothetical protein JO307_08680 [Bryobacterales bacterium]|nr:hypothetical protein [Bryobacterales bacterium]